MAVTVSKLAVKARIKPIPVASARTVKRITRAILVLILISFIVTAWAECASCLSLFRG
jgi:hypothetical protein